MQRSRQSFQRQNIRHWIHYNICVKYVSHDVGKRNTSGSVRPVQIQISLRIRAVWSEPSLGAFWIAKDSKFRHADNEDSDQIARMRRLIWVFVGGACQKVRLLSLCLVYVEMAILTNTIAFFSVENSCASANMLKIWSVGRRSFFFVLFFYFFFTRKEQGRARNFMKIHVQVITGLVFYFFI